jgi:hypothetical protein
MEKASRWTCGLRETACMDLEILHVIDAPFIAFDPSESSATKDASLPLHSAIFEKRHEIMG